MISQIPQPYSIQRNHAKIPPVSFFTCAELYEGVEDVDDVTQVVKHKPYDEVVLLELPEYGSCDDHGEVVEHGERDDPEPAVVSIGGRIDHPSLPEPKRRKID